MADRPDSRVMPGTASPCASKHCRSARFQSVGLHNRKPRKTLHYVHRSFFASNRTVRQNSLEDSLRGSESPRGTCKTQRKGLYGPLVDSQRPPKPAHTTSTQTGRANGQISIPHLDRSTPARIATPTGKAAPPQTHTHTLYKHELRIQEYHARYG